MKNTRIALLEKYIEETPHDPFNHYALAMELIPENTEKAFEILKVLVSEYEDYVPTYYQLAKLLESKQEYSKALKIYEKGLGVAMYLKDHKAYSELQRAYHTLAESLED